MKLNLNFDIPKTKNSTIGMRISELEQISCNLGTLCSTPQPPLSIIPLEESSLWPDSRERSILACQLQSTSH